MVEPVAVVVELRKPDKDGKLRLLHPRTDAERGRLIRGADRAVCELGMSYRQAQRQIEPAGVCRLLRRRFVGGDWPPGRCTSG